MILIIYKSHFSVLNVNVFTSKFTFWTTRRLFTNQHIMIQYYDVIILFSTQQYLIKTLLSSESSFSFHELLPFGNSHEEVPLRYLQPSLIKYVISLSALTTKWRKVAKHIVKCFDIQDKYIGCILNVTLGITGCTVAMLIRCCRRLSKYQKKYNYRVC